MTGLIANGLTFDWARTHFVKDDIAVPIDGKIHRTSGREIEGVANLLGDGNLAFAGD